MSDGKTVKKDSGTITGNKGEWSEVYAFLKMLGSGRLYSADADLNKTNLYYEINRIIRTENSDRLEYSLSDDGDYAEIVHEGKVIAKAYRERIIEEGEYLLEAIRTGEGRTFSVICTQKFMEELHSRKLKAPSNDKSDITVEIHDPRTGMNPELGFSIKSYLGGAPTLFNASIDATNFVFRLKGNVSKEMVETVNDKNAKNGTKRMTMAQRFTKLVESGVGLEFVHTGHPVLEDNLRLINYILPQVVAEMLKLHYVEAVNNVGQMVKILNERNFLGFRNVDSYDYYKFMIKKLLTSVALGMQADTPWNGFEEANGGYIVVKESGDIVCYHIYNRNEFEEYLITHTQLETPSTSRHRYSQIYEGDDGELYLKLNLQIRFI